MPLQLERAQGLVERGHLALALQHVDLHAASGSWRRWRRSGCVSTGMVVLRSIRRVEHVAHRLHAQAKAESRPEAARCLDRRRVQHASLQWPRRCATHSSGLMPLKGSLPVSALHRVLHRRNAGRAAHQQHLGQLRGADARVRERLIAPGPSSRPPGRLVSSSNLARVRRDFHVRRAVCAHRQEGQVDRACS